MANHKDRMLQKIGQLGLMIYWIQKIGGSKSPDPISFAESKQ